MKVYFGFDDTDKSDISGFDDNDKGFFSFDDTDKAFLV